MNRFFTTLTVFAILFVAVGLSIRETLLRGSDASVLAIEILAGGGLIGGSALLIRHRYLRRKGGVKRSGFGFVQPIRRLLSTVWS